MTAGEGRKSHARRLLGIIPILFFIGFSLFFYFYATPSEVVARLGVTNAYSLIFILAFFGGLTVFSGIPYHVILVTLAAGGLHPFLLGFSAAVGVMLGDTTSYYVGYHGGAVAPERVRGFFEQWYLFFESHPKVLPIFCFLYGSLVPFSNDFITISAGIARYPFWRVMVPLGLGNLIFNVSLSYLAVYAYGFFQSVF